MHVTSQLHNTLKLHNKCAVVVSSLEYWVVVWLTVPVLTISKFIWHPYRAIVVPRVLLYSNCDLPTLKVTLSPQRDQCWAGWRG